MSSSSSSEIRTKDPSVMLAIAPSTGDETNGATQGTAILAGTNGAFETVAQLSEDEVQQMQKFMQEYSIGSSTNFSTIPDQSNMFLAPLVDHATQLTELTTNNRLTEKENQELSAIRNETKYNDFYFMMYMTLDNAVTGCQALASGLVAHGSDNNSLRVWLGGLVRDGAWNTLKEFPPFRKIVTGAIQWANRQFPLPLGDFAVTLIQVLSSIKEERDKYIAMAHVVAFGVAAKNSSGGLHLTLSRVCRYVLRSRRLTIGESPEFAPWQTWATRLLADPASTRAKADGRLAAELVLEVIMKGSVNKNAIGSEDLAIVLASAALKMDHVAIMSLTDLATEMVDTTLPLYRQSTTSRSAPIVTLVDVAIQATESSDIAFAQLVEDVTILIEQARTFSEEWESRLNHLEDQLATFRQHQQQRR